MSLDLNAIKAAAAARAAQRGVTSTTTTTTGLTATEWLCVTAGKLAAKTVKAPKAITKDGGYWDAIKLGFNTELVAGTDYEVK